MDTRLRKLKEGQFDAIILAAAGVKRLGLAENVTEYIDPGVSLPAIGQGALGIECRVDDRELNDLIAFFNHADSRTCVTGERALLRRLEGGCQVPIACYGQMKDGKLQLTGLVGSVDGKRIIKDCIEGAPDKAEKLGVDSGREAPVPGRGRDPAGSLRAQDGLQRQQPAGELDQRTSIFEPRQARRSRRFIPHREDFSFLRELWRLRGNFIYR